MGLNLIKEMRIENSIIVFVDYAAEYKEGRPGCVFVKCA